MRPVFKAFSHTHRFRPESGCGCPRLLNHPDAEDALQATFLVHKAADVPGQAVANWLYGVARQTALRATVGDSGEAGAA